MRGISLTLGDLTVTARLCEAEAPVTAQRLWERLPLVDRFEHSIWSGMMLHTTHHPDLGLDTTRYPLVENPVTYVEAGDVIVWPQNGCLSVAYGPSRFRWLASEWIVTKVGHIDGDLAAFAREAYRMMFEGSRSISLARVEHVRSEPAPALPADARLIEVELGGQTWVAELLTKEAPEYSQAVWDGLPIEGPTSVTHSSGEVLHCWTTFQPPATPPRARTVIPVEIGGRAIGGTYVAVDPRAMRGQHPGDIIWGQGWNDLRIIYGQGRFGGDGLKFAHIVRGDLDALAEQARAVLRDGSRTVKLRRYSP